MGCASSTSSDNVYDDSMIDSYRGNRGTNNQDNDDNEEENEKFKDFEEIGSK